MVIGRDSTGADRVADNKSDLYADWGREVVTLTFEHEDFSGNLLDFRYHNIARIDSSKNGLIRMWMSSPPGVDSVDLEGWDLKEDFISITIDPYDMPEFMSHVLPLVKEINPVCAS